MRQLILKILRSKMVQPLWIKLHHFSLIGMNYYGGASLFSSGEIATLKYIQRKLKSKDNIIIFDVGANTGEYSLTADRIFKGRAIIYAFEPSAFTFNQLLGKTQSISNIKPQKVGIGSVDSILQLHSGGKGRTTASVYDLKSREKEFLDEFTEDIEVISIDSFCLKNKIQCVDLLKLDIEGHEFHGLKGAKTLIDAMAVHFIQFEFGKCDIDAKVHFRDFYELLSPRFKLYRIVSDGLHEIKKYESGLEIFQTANFLAEKKS